MDALREQLEDSIDEELERLDAEDYELDVDEVDELEDRS